MEKIDLSHESQTEKIPAAYFNILTATQTVLEQKYEGLRLEAHIHSCSYYNNEKIFKNF